MKTKLLIISLFVTIIAITPALAAVGNIHTDDKYAWSENAGWINFRPEHGGVTIHDNGDNSFLTGYVWGENIGFIRLAFDDNGPFANDAVNN